MTARCSLCGLDVAVEQGKFIAHRKVIKGKLEACAGSGVRHEPDPPGFDVFARIARGAH